MSYLSSSLLSKRRFRRLIAAIIIICAICVFLIVPFERTSPEAEITTYFDATYWVINTVTSTGYGDLVPVTPAGKIVSIILELGAASLFSIIFVLIGVTMAQSAEHFHFKRIQDRLDEMEEKLEAVHKHQRAHQSLSSNSEDLSDLDK